MLHVQSEIVMKQVDKYYLKTDNNKETPTPKSTVIVSLNLHVSLCHML